jgi:hypothetical protein
MIETTAPAIADAVSRYLEFWNSTPDEQRRTGDRTFAVDANYIAPIGVLSGVDALADFTEQFVSNMGSYRFQTRTEPDIHHGYARLAWEIRTGDTSFAEGTDVLTIDDAGLVTSVATFVDRAPEVAAHHEHG